MITLQSDDHIIGSETAAVTIVGYCDFECPYCGRAYYRIKQLRNHFGDRFRFVFRHFPLVDKHVLAQQAAEAAEAAAIQDRFWAMHDLLFEYQEQLERGNLFTYASMAGLDVPRFKDDLGNRRFSSRVVRDVRTGRRQGVTGTPTFFLNDRLLQDDDSLERMVLRAA